MGQYYKPVNTKNLSWVYSWDYDAGLKLMEHSWFKNDFVGAVESMMVPGGLWYKQPIIWAGDYADHVKGEDENYYELTENGTKLLPNAQVVKQKYLYNHTKKQFVDKSKTPADKDGWRIHPLPILTADGNGQGGGDLHEERCSGNYSLVGSWVGDVISVESRKPVKSLGFTELEFDLTEKY